MKEIAMVKKEMFDRYGNPIEDDVLPDGGSVRVPMLLMDGSTVELEDWQREIVWAHRFGLDDAADLHRPGPRRCSDEGTAAKARAYADSVQNLQDAWKVPLTPPAEPMRNVTGVGSGTNRRAQPGDPDERQDSAPVYDAVKGQRIKDAAYAEMVNELVTAWQRKP
jgi:hypothetical protein